MFKQFLAATAFAPIVLILVSQGVYAQQGEREVIFEEDFTDISLPGWHGARPGSVNFSRAEGPGGVAALTMEAAETASSNLSVRLPVERIAGRAVLLDVWRKAEDVRTGEQHYYNAKSMLSWKAKGEAKRHYSGTLYSDFSGTFDWERHRFVVNMPEDLEEAAVSIGLQACTGKASWAELTVSVDPRFPNQQALERFLAREQREAYAKLDASTLAVKCLDGGIIQVFTGDRYVPRKYWNEAVRQAVLANVPRVDESQGRSGSGFGIRLSRALQRRAEDLEAGLKGVRGPGLNDRVYEIASLRERVRQMATDTVEREEVVLKVDVTSELAVSPLVFGNNINTQNLSAPYDSARGKFDDEFLKRVRPMGIAFLRYPGGCNADVFDWRDTVGPLDRRKDIINYHNGTSRGIAKFGVDEYLRFCEEEGMEPLITTAFCKDRPEKVDPNDHPNGIRHEYVFSYLKTAPERVQLAADWVEYCNGSTDTPMGMLRAENGHPEPYGVKYWEVGNESYGPDPTGSCKPEEYAKAFPAYVRAMKARDPSIQVVMNGCGRAEWDEPVLQIAGKHADAFQFHIYHTPRIVNYLKLEGQPHNVADGMRSADSIPARLDGVTSLMKEHLGRTLPIIISEFGMGNARNREFMTSVTSPVLVADMWRTLIESPAILGANKWCLFTGYWFSQIQGPTLTEPDAPYYNRPEQIMHVIYARCRGEKRLAVGNDASEGVKAVVFKRPDSYGVVLISREPVSWHSVVVDLPGARRGEATCLLMTAGHPFLGNENDHGLVKGYEFEFDYVPGEPLMLPSNSVVGLVVPR
jgi:hypothetical protein